MTQPMAEKLEDMNEDLTGELFDEALDVQEQNRICAHFCPRASG